MSHPYVKVATSLQNHHCSSNINPNSSTAMTAIPCACPMAAFSGFYESPGPHPSGDVHGIVPPHRDGHWNGHQSGYILHLCIVCCCPGGRQGNTEWVVAQWRHPVAFGVALDMLHWAMPHQNGLRRRCIRSSPPPFLLGVIIANDHVMVHLN